MGRKRTIKTVVAIGLVLALFGLGVLRIMEYQIVDHESYVNAANRGVSTTVDIYAGRGEIRDRDGNLLATNRTSFNIVFDRQFLPYGGENEVIERLVDLMSTEGVLWNDSLPISETAPYFFDETREEDVAKLKTLLGRQSYATAEDCVNAMIEMFKLEKYSGGTLRQIMGVRYEMLLMEFSIYNQYIFAEDVTIDIVTAIEVRDDLYPGVSVDERSARVYSDGDLAPHLIGTVGKITAEQYQSNKDNGYGMNDYMGQSGIEYALEEYLRGENGTKTILQSQGDTVEANITKEAIAGNNVTLTLDSNLQQAVQQIIQDYVDGAHGTNDTVRTAAGVVIDVSNGDILSAVNYPNYDATLYQEDAVYRTAVNDDERNPMYNRAFQGQYRPGSTFKTITAAAALLNGTVTAQDTVFCGRTYTYWAASGYTPGCTGSHSNISVVQAINVSCNIYFYDVGRRMGIDTLIDYSTYFGVGQDTGVEIGSSEGRMSSPEYRESLGERWEAGYVVMAAIGQQDTELTPLQLAVQAMTLANKGLRYEAHLVKRIETDQGELVKETGAVIADDTMYRMEGSKEVFDTITEGMVLAAGRSGVGYNGGDVALKTGTPQTDLTGERTNSVVVGFYPAENPEIAFAFLLEDGKSSVRMVNPLIQAYEAIKAGTYEPKTDDTPSDPTSSDSTEN